MADTNGYDQAWEESIAKERVNAILQANKNKNFVQRIIDPTTVPPLPMPEYGPGGIGTHLISSGSVDGIGSIVYPEIVYDEQTKKLKRLSRSEAVKHALKSKEYISFPNDEDALWFGENYKKVWDEKTWKKLRGDK